jgi:hypothetical protein
MRRANIATCGVMAGMFIAAGGSSGLGAAHAYRAVLLAATSTCASPPVATASATRPDAGAQTATLDAAVFAAGTSPSASPSATASATPSATAAASATPTPTPTPNASSSSSPSSSPSATPTPTPTPTRTPTPTPTATPTTKPKTPKLCVEVKPFSSSKVHPGGTASYMILVWSTEAESLGASVTVSVGNAAHVDAPTFTVCPQAKTDVCTVGDLLTTQSEELVAAARVADTASAGEKVTLTATVKASKATSFHASATIDVVSPSTPAPSASASGSVGADVPSLPGGFGGLGAVTSPTNPSGLFPTVSPTGSSATTGKTRKKAQNAPGTTTVAAVLPLDSRLIGGQLVGLVVLASAIAIAIARLSLRARPHDSGGNSSA